MQEKLSPSKAFNTVDCGLLDYYHQKVNTRIASRVAKLLKTYDLRKLRNFKQIPGMLELDRECQAGHLKKPILTFMLENRQKSAIKHFIEKSILLNFAKLSTIFCRR